MITIKNKLLLIIAVLTLALAFTTCRSPADPPAVYTVTFDARDGAENTTRQVTEGGAISAPNLEPFDEDYGIAGWYRDETFTEKWDFAAGTVTADITLYAKWALQINIDDFGPDAVIDHEYTVKTTAEWHAAREDIIGNGNNRNYIISITGDFAVEGSMGRSFGALSGLKVSIRGDRAVSLSTVGCVLGIEREQAVIVRDVDFKGRADNSTTLVYVRDGELTLRGSASVSGNTINSSQAHGGGVFVTEGTLTMRDTATIYGNTGSASSHALGGGISVNYGTFTMRDKASVSGNKAVAVGPDSAHSYGGGVFINSGTTFTMRDKATISGNTATSTKKYSQGGGLYAGGTFQIEGGTIYGNTADANSNNADISGAALYEYGTIQYGTFNGDTFVPTDPQEPPLSTTDNTIKVVNGVLVQS